MARHPISKLTVLGTAGEHFLTDLVTDPCAAVIDVLQLMLNFVESHHSLGTERRHRTLHRDHRRGHRRGQILEPIVKVVAHRPRMIIDSEIADRRSIADHLVDLLGVLPTRTPHSHHSDTRRNRSNNAGNSVDEPGLSD